MAVKNETTSVRKTSKTRYRPMIWAALAGLILLLAGLTYLFTQYSNPVAQIYGWAARASALLGNVDLAYQTADRAAALSPDNAEFLNKRCWYGALAGDAANVIDDCERTVEMKPGKMWAHDSRGVARMILGDYSGAIADFQLGIVKARASSCCSKYIEERQSYIDDMNAGRSPFDEEALKSLLLQ